ncbi:PREDICTED: anaphase-promoting complex subunit 4 [Nicrophorus vespilloides]|uniref:Anaphase-promoting complex subunit 4 n=1 Tax=Nicrophorus vespilloides TaxID=110193 RepID=A0ABM1N1U6_NICVS|nr:PREDICTED: anaphase-promoting complex subunit 4 [Nicrophorus vespilloides]
MLSIIRQLEEKKVANEIDILVWSDRMDLVAFSNIKGDVSLHRLTWTRAWILPPSKEGLLVRAMAWRPDGKTLAIGYNSGEVLLINVENKTTLHTLDIKEGEITYISWTQEKKKDPAEKRLLMEQEEHNKYTQHIDQSSIFLPNPPSLSTYSTSSGQDETIADNFFQNQKELNLLAIGTSEGFVHLSIFGCFYCAILNVNEIIGVGKSCQIVDLYLSELLDRLYITVKDNEQSTKVLVLNSEIFNTHVKELFNYAIKYKQIEVLVEYLSEAISSITEAWENILLEMDSKLAKFASQTPTGTLSADFLDLLMFGNSSELMQSFLLQDLTKKGLEKFGQSIEMSYVNIQKLLLKNVTKVAQNITYHLGELRGMARLEHRYKLLGLDEKKINEAIASNGAFLIKSGEMQQIINNSMLNYKAFFRWLYTAIIHLIYETVPNEIPKMTQQDLAYITAFLKNFDDITGHNNTTIGGTEKNTGFIMERLGQYLADSPLHILPNMEHNEWDNFLQHNECIRAHPSVIKHFKEMSLLQQFKHLEKALMDIFNEPHDLISADITLIKCINCNTSSSWTLVSKINASNGSLLFAFNSDTHHTDSFYLLEFDPVTFVTKAALVKIPKYFITDLKFYNENIVSLLLQEPSTKHAVLYQCSIATIRERLQEIDVSEEVATQNLVQVDGLQNNQHTLKSISMVSSKFAVSGARRVSIVLSENGKKVILFEMEGDEEEEEDADMTASTLREADVSMQENSDAE